MARYLVCFLMLACFAGVLRAQTPALVKPNSWYIWNGVTTLPMADDPPQEGAAAPMPGDANGTCQAECRRLYPYPPPNVVDGAWRANLVCSGGYCAAGDYTGSLQPGLNNKGYFYGRCHCWYKSAAGARYDENPPPFYAVAPSICSDANEVRVLSYYPGTCVLPYGTTPAGYAPVSACTATKNVKRDLGVTTAGTAPTSLCYQGCRYLATGPFTVVGTMAVAEFTGTGGGCVPLDSQASYATAPEAPASSAGVGGGVGALESTQQQNRGLLESILSAIGANPGNAGGDLARIATATEAAVAEPAPGSLEASLAAEGRAAMEAAAAASAGTLDGVHAALPAELFDFSNWMTTFTATVFGAGSCPAAMELFDMGTVHVTLPFEYICQALSAVSIFVVLGGAMSGFKMAFS